MSSSGKNIITILGILTVVFAGYYFLSQDASSVIRTSESDQQLQQMLIKTRDFVEHRRILDGVNLDTALFSDARFTNLRDFSPEPESFRVERNNPFIPALPERSSGVSSISPVVESANENTE